MSMRRMRSIILVIVFSILVVSSSSFLLASRTEVGYAYSNLHPWFMPTFLVTILFVAALIMSGEKSHIKISFVIVISIVTCLFYSIVFVGGPGYDSWVHLGTSRRIYDNVFYDAYGLPWTMSFRMPVGILLKIYLGTADVLQHSLSVIFARSFGVDIYWAHLLLVPLMWGSFIPVVAYSISKDLCKERRAALLSGFLVLSIPSLILWGSVSVPQSIGYVFFFFTLHLLLQYLSHNKNIFPALISASASFIGHFVTGVFSFTLILLAFGFKNHRTWERKKVVSMRLIMAFVLCVCILPFAYYMQQYFYPAYGGFTLSKLFELSTYDAVFSLLFTVYENYTIRQFVTYGGVIELLGFLGLLINSIVEHKRIDKQLCHFLLLAFIIIVIDVRILTWFMVDVVSPQRIWHCATLIAIPSAAVLIIRLIDSLSPTRRYKMSTTGMINRKTKLRLPKFNSRKAIVMMISVCTLFGMVAVSVNSAFFSWPNLLTGYEIDAAKYIDETTPPDQKYVVICDTKFMLAGYAVVGIRNPRAFYPYRYDYPEVLGLFGEMVSNPSPEVMIKAAALNDASYQYFVVSTSSPVSYWHTSLTRVIERASIYFEEYGVFGDGNFLIYVFRYRIPPFPLSSDVSAFYWVSPSSYIVQNDLVRVLVPENKSLELREPFEGKLYEGIDFDKTLVDGSTLGNVSVVEYFDPYGKTWIEWGAPGEVALGFAMKQQFRFKLVFTKVALVVTVERGKPFAQFRWESLDGVSHNITVHLQTERYDQFVISGLTSVESPGSVHLRKYGAYYTVSRTENVNIHYAYEYGAYGSGIYPYPFKDYCKFHLADYYLWYDLYVDNEASFGQWVYLEIYLPDTVSGAVSAPFEYSIDGGKNWTYIGGGRGPLKTVNGTEVNWVITGARQWAEKPKLWVNYLDGVGGKYSLPDSFIDSGGSWNRIIFGMYLLGDTNTGSETFSGKDEGDQVLIRIGIGENRDIPFETTYVFKDSDDASYGLRKMDDVFLTFTTGTENIGGIVFTKKLGSIFVTATREDKIEHVIFNVPCNTSFSLLAQFTDSAVYESLAQFSYVISESDNEISLMARVESTNEWDQPAIVTICIPSNYRNDGGELLFVRGKSNVLRVEVINENTEAITIYP